ncbi:MAG: hypothetical protein KTR29_11890 [Rhodothermaceae bacterium]|nr:hypothetical protein [Rhodothermaceae bacterium]
MALTHLLELWADIEPSRCSYASGIFVLRGWSLSYDTDLSERLTLSEIQSAVQDAIEHRGWNWYLGRVEINKETYYKAAISIPSYEEEAKAHTADFLSTHSTSYVLLEAYLHTLVMYSPELFDESIEWMHEQLE